MSESHVAVNDTVGEACDQSYKLEIVNLLLWSPVNSETIKSLKWYIAKYPEFSAKALLFMRIECGIKTITHTGAAMLAKHISGVEWSKRFYDKIVCEVSDMTSILSHYIYYNKTFKMPNAMRKGFCKAFDKFGNYQLVNHVDSGSIKIADIIRLVHPIPTIDNALALQTLVSGKSCLIDASEYYTIQGGMSPVISLDDYTNTIVPHIEAIEL